MEFSSSEDDNDKAERKLTTRNKIASALTTKFVLKKPMNQDTKDVTPRDSDNLFGFPSIRS